jgi:membrane protease YdiL (CAAX protease family)
MFQMSSFVYGIMLVIGLTVMHFAHDSITPAFKVPAEILETLRLLLIGGMSAGFLLILSHFFEDWFPSFRELKGVIMGLLGPSSWSLAIYLALVSSLGEEVLFRGAIQPFAGLVLTSVFFGLMHLGRDGRISSWSVWAMGAGLLLGWTYEETQSLWPPIVGHFIVNCVSIFNLRRNYRAAALTMKTAALENSADETETDD